MFVLEKSGKSGTVCPMTLPQHNLETDRAGATGTGPGVHEQDLRRRGILAALASCAGTCAAVAIWLVYGVLPGAAVLVATFMLLVIFLMTSSERAARGSVMGSKGTPDLKSDKLVP